MMKNRFPAVLAIGLLIIVCQTDYSRAQDYTAPQVTVSKEKTKMGGKLYYSHIVLEKQTLYSISKAYGVSLDDIYSANPGLKETGLKKNAVILIPDLTAKEQEKGRKKKAGKEEDKYTVHTVRWYEDLDVIAEKYGVTVESIMELNNLKGRKLKNRQKLRIPSATEVSAAEPEAAAQGPVVPATSGDVQNVSPENRTTTGISSSILPLFRKNSVDISLLLPLAAGDSTSGSRSNMDFYSGALLAARQLGKEGVGIDLSVYDVADGQMHITEDRLKSSDVVIGPVSAGDLGRLLASAPNSTYIVSPLDHRAEPLALSYKNFIQAPSSSAAQYADLADWIREEKSPHDTVIIIHEKGIRDRTGINTLTQGLKENGIGFQTFSYNILEGRDIPDSLRSRMTLTARNHLMIASESEAFVNDVIRNINLMVHEKYDVAVYASSKIRGFDTIEGANLHNVNLHVSASYYIDYDQKEVQDFIMDYRALFNTEPTPFAFQGYDIILYFAGICSKYGNAWPAMLPLEEEELLQSGFRFSRVVVGQSEVGFANTAIRRITYGPDYSVSLSKGL
jgi:LysM repeat protein